MPLSEEQIAAGWVEHDGGGASQRMLPTQEVMFRSGLLGKRLNGWIIWHDLAPMHNDIIAYRKDPGNE